MPKIVSRMSVHVKAPDSNNGTAWMLRCLGALLLDNSEHFLPELFLDSSLFSDTLSPVGNYIWSAGAYSRFSI